MEKIIIYKLNNVLLKKEANSVLINLDAMVARGHAVKLK